MAAKLETPDKASDEGGAKAPAAKAMPTEPELPPPQLSEPMARQTPANSPKIEWIFKLLLFKLFLL
jgi:hypothetical protein